MVASSRISCVREHRRRMDDRAARIEADDVKRAFADIDANR
jgi:hypothetical protein